MKKERKNPNRKKILALLVLSGIVLQGIVGCTLDPSDEEKEEMQKEMSQAIEEVQSAFEEAYKEVAEMKEELQNDRSAEG